MKAHIQRDPLAVLLWRFGPQDTGYDALAQAARRHKLTLRILTPADLGTTVGDLCAGRAAVPCTQDGSAHPLPAMIVSGLRPDNGSLNDFVESVRKGGAVLPLRAMVTPTSKSWKLDALLDELAREHDSVGQPHA